jgi:hypothetical protein
VSFECRAEGAEGEHPASLLSARSAAGGSLIAGMAMAEEIAESGLNSRASGAIRARSGREGFGFSNDAGRSKKALSFNEAKFDLPPTGCRTVRIVLKYEHGEVTDQCLYRGNIMVRG